MWGGLNIRYQSQRASSRRVAVVPINLQTLPNLEAVRERLLIALVEASRHRPLLMVLPAYTGLMTLHLFTRQEWRFDQSLFDAAQRFGVAAEETLLDWSRALARQLDVYLVPGTCLVPTDKGLEHVAYLISPQGELLGRQAQTHVSPAEAGWGLVPGVEIAVWDVEGLRLGIAVNTDAWYPEVGRIVALQGGTLMLCPTAVPTKYERWRQLSGCWQQVQSNQFFAVEAAAGGNIGGQLFVGRGAISAPIELTEDGRGYLAETGGDAIAADLNFQQLFKVRRDYPLAHWFNTRFYDRYFPQLYIERHTAASVTSGGGGSW